jgi:hypothetical protein
MHRHRTHRSGSTKQLALSLLFAVFLVLPAAVHGWRGDLPATGTGENRRLASPPTWREVRTDPTGMPAAVTTWLRDHFGLRSQFIRLFTSLRDRIGLRPDDRVITGTDGWLYLGGKPVLMHQGLRPFLPGEAQAWITRFEEIERSASRRQIPFVACIAPNKHTARPEHLPTWMDVQPHTPRVETLLDGLGADYPVMFPLEPLQALGQDERIYSKTDTHWTGHGARCCADLVFEALCRQDLSLAPIAGSEVTERHDAAFSGDLAGLLGLGGTLTESIDDLVVPPAHGVVSEEPLPEYDIQGLAAVRLLGPSDGDGRKLLLVSDSFGEALVPFLGLRFAEITWIRHVRAGFDASIWDETDYDAAVFVVVERALADAPRRESP